MRYTGCVPFLFSVLVLTASIRPLHASKIDLSRATPVPANEEIPVQDFFRPRLLQQPVLNPSGTRIAAAISAGEDKHELLVYNLADQKEDRMGALGDKDIYGVRWLSDDRLMFSIGYEKKSPMGLFVTGIRALNEVHPIFQYYNSSVVALPASDRMHPLIWNRYDRLTDEANHDLGVAEAYADVRTGEMINLEVAADGMELQHAILDTRKNNERHVVHRFPLPKEGIVDWYIADKEGHLEFCVVYVDGEPRLLRLAGDHWEKCPVDLTQIDVLTCGNKPGELVVRGPRRDGKPRAVQFMDGATGQLGEVIVDDKDYDFYSGDLSDGYLYRDPITRKIVGVMYDRDGPTTVWFNDSYRHLQLMLEKMFPGQVVRIIDSDDAQKVFLIATFSDRQPVQYQWADLGKQKAGLLQNSAPWIDPKRMRPMIPIHFKTRDGHHLDAYLTLPAGATKQHPPPMVVLPHGGPWARDCWGFDGEVQFLASRGYAVLQPNYRGSNGYDWRFPVDDQYDFVKMHDDVTDATKALMKSGYIDPKRVAIMGGSFGGYLAVDGVVNEPDLYRCAVTVAGVFDWAKHISETKYYQYESYVYGYFMRHLGSPKSNPEYFDAISPGRHVDRIKVPVFVAGGGDDPRVEIAQSKDLLSELERYHVPHESYIASEETHGMHHLDKQVELYTRIEAFLAKYLAPEPGATAAAGSP